MKCHVAIVTPPYDRLILSGEKTVECRLTRNLCPPFGCIAPGERVYFKRSGGAFFATAVVDRVWMADHLTPQLIEQIRQRHNGEILGHDDYFVKKRSCRYATLAWLREVRPSSVAPRYKPQVMRAWYTLGDIAEPVTRSPVEPRGESIEVVLTQGCINQSQVRLNRLVQAFPSDCRGGRTRSQSGKPMTLLLLGGYRVETDIVSDRKMFRWRGWSGWFERHGLRAGDRLRFIPRGRRAFEVLPLRGPK